MGFRRVIRHNLCRRAETIRGERRRFLIFWRLVAARAAAICLCLVLSRSARAEIVHFKMTGHITVDFQVGALPDGIYEGAPFEANLSYDRATPDSSPDDPQRGLYQTVVGPNNFLRFQAGPAEINAHDLWLWMGNNVDGGPTIENGRPLWEHEDDTFRMFDSQLITNFPVAPFHQMVFDWRDSTRKALTSDALPTNLDLSAFSDTWIRISTGSLNDRDNQFTARGIVESVAAVPEPIASMMIVVYAYILLLFERRRRTTL